MSKTIWHYVVMKSVFGDFWVGKTKLPLQKEVVFEDIEDAIEKAKVLFEHNNPEFEIELFENEEAGNDEELEQKYREIIDTKDNPIEVIGKKLEKHIVGVY